MSTSDQMEIDPAEQQPLQPGSSTKPSKSSSSKSQTLTQLTISSPPFSYVHLSAFSPPSPSSSQSQSQSQSQPQELVTLDPLLLSSYLTTALRRFLGDSGVAIPIDILKISCPSSSPSSGPASAWVRVPRQDLSAFAAAVTAFAGIPNHQTGQIGANQERRPTLLLLQVKACGDYLGSLLARSGTTAGWGRMDGGGGEDEEEESDEEWDVWKM